jgi:plastocyanin/DNA-binding beta-propeller fold protein YncE
MLVLAALPGLTLRSAAKGPVDFPAAELYVAERTGSGTLVPLDAGSLVAMPDRPEVSFDATTSWVPEISADGSTLATVFGISTVVIGDGLFGPERSRIDADGELGEVHLSRDGRRLVAMINSDYSGAGLRSPFWKVFDTRDGRLLTTIQSDDPEQWQVFAVDGGVERLYVLTVAEGTSPQSGPNPTRLIAYDLTTGKELGRLELPEVRAGFWMSDEVVEFEGGGEEQLGQARVPGFALSPDGRRITIAHADDDGLTVIDTSKLTVERTTTIAPKQGWLGRLAGLLPLTPEGASAKAMEGKMLDAIFSPDGKRLYLFGMEAAIEEGMPTYRGLGLRAIDPESGEIAVEAPREMQVERVVPSPDGGSLYVSGWADEATNANPNPPFLIQRVDAETLEVLAEQEYTDWRPFLLRSALADPALPLTVELAEMAFVPQHVVAPAETAIELVLTNHDEMAHNFTADDEAGRLDVRVDLAPGETKSVTILAPAGEFKMFCDVAGHPEAGMGGILVVTDVSAP